MPNAVNNTTNFKCINGTEERVGLWGWGRVQGGKGHHLISWRSGGCYYDEAGLMLVNRFEISWNYAGVEWKNRKCQNCRRKYSIYKITTTTTTYLHKYNPQVLSCYYSEGGNAEVEGVRGL